MKKDLVIFGTGKIAEVIAYYATEECGFKIAAFTVDSKYKTSDSFCGKPVVAFEEIEQHYPAAKFDAFVAVGYHDLNKVREARFNDMLAKGYQLVSIVSPLANVPKNVSIGRNCFIMSPAIIHPCVTIADDVFVWSGAMVGHHSTVEAHVWLTSACSISGNVVLGHHTFVAVNATVGHSVKIGAECFLGANTLVTKSIEDKVVVIQESNKPARLNSTQFLRISSFSSL